MNGPLSKCIVINALLFLATCGYSYLKLLSLVLYLCGEVLLVAIDILLMLWQSPWHTAAEGEMLWTVCRTSVLYYIK